MKHFILFFLILINAFSFSQSNSNFIKVKYKSFLLDEREQYACFSYEENTLISNNNYSYYYEKARDTIFVTQTMGDVNNISSTYNFTYFKDFKRKELSYNRNYASKEVIIDSTNIIKWKLTNNYNLIMGYKCQEAVGKFRGRNYKAYFLKDIPISNGPFKFDGLPGLILKVVSDDGCVKIEAFYIEENEEINFNFTNPFIGEKSITWKEFKKKYSIKVEKMRNYNPDDGLTYNIPIGYIENYLDN